MKIDACDIRCQRCGCEDLEERPGVAVVLHKKCRTRDFYCVPCNLLVARWRAVDEDKIIVRDARNEKKWLTFSRKTGERVHLPQIPREKYEVLINHARMLIGMRQRYTDIRLIIQKEYQVGLWAAERYLDRALRMERQELAKIQGLTPDELDCQNLQRSLRFWEEVVRTAEDLKDRMAAQRELDKINAIHKPPKETEKTDKEQTIHVHFWSPDNQRSRKALVLDQEPLRLPAPSPLATPSTIDIRDESKRPN